MYIPICTLYCIFIFHSCFPFSTCFCGEICYFLEEAWSVCCLNSLSQLIDKCFKNNHHNNCCNHHQSSSKYLSSSALIIFAFSQILGSLRGGWYAADAEYWITSRYTWYPIHYICDLFAATHFVTGQFYSEQKFFTLLWNGSINIIQGKLKASHEYTQ